MGPSALLGMRETEREALFSFSLDRGRQRTEKGRAPQREERTENTRVGCGKIYKISKISKIFLKKKKCFSFSVQIRKH